MRLPQHANKSARTRSKRTIDCVWKSSVRSFTCKACCPMLLALRVFSGSRACPDVQNPQHVYKVVFYCLTHATFPRLAHSTGSAAAQPTAVWHPNSQQGMTLLNENTWDGGQLAQCLPRNASSLKASSEFNSRVWQNCSVINAAAEWQAPSKSSPHV